MSNGGSMTVVLACTLFDRVAAVGMVSPGLDPDWNFCKDRRPMPAIAFHGTADPICPYAGGRSKLGGGPFAGIRGFMADWARQNHCRSNSTESPVAPDVTRLDYTDCEDDAGVVLYSVKGGGHQWPGGERIVAQWLVGRYSDGVDATRQMWAFFSRHPLPGAQ
jgi:polyhydroxybutyrate depolymerase